MDSVLLAELTWTEVEAAFEHEPATVLVPLGATEQHGPHLPLGTDTTIATALARRVAQRLENALVAPPIPVGPSTEHDSFPGTLSIPSRLLEDLLAEHVDSLASHAVDRIVLLPAHGGSFAAVNAVVPTLAAETDADLVGVSNLEQYMELLAEGLAESGIDVDEPVVHAGATETSMLLALDREAVREDELVVGYEDAVSPARLFNRGIDVYSSEGVLGDSRKATADAGDEIVDRVVDAYVGLIREEFRALEDE
ncbi:creatininase family protein [Haloarchaeobius amylolyticus]|uniref:Creatininase family protein n=1 Tax=Haloarchaeobius amylolyticus TaxID=1198296 RepID=A0ABD6BIQ6_9EURY